MPKLSVVVSQGQSANPAKRGLEEEIVTSLLFEKGIEVTVVPHLYDLKPDGTGLLALQGIAGDMIVLSWLYPRAAHWLLDRHRIKGHAGRTLLEVEPSEDEDEEGPDDAAEDNGKAEPVNRGIGARDLPSRRIYCLDLRTPGKAAAYVAEIQRIAAESTVQTFDLMSFIGGAPKPEQMQRYLEPGPGNVGWASPTKTAPLSGSDTEQLSTQQTNTQQTNVDESAAQSARLIREASPAIPEHAVLVGEAHPTNGRAPTRVEEETDRRWYPVIDFSRCTNCLECLDFCLFGVYGIDRAETILVEQPDNCRKGCPACSRVCPANAIIFPQHKSPAIAGSADKSEGAFKIDLSKLFGAPEGDPLQTAVRERDEQLLLSGRAAVGMAVGVPKRQEGKSAGPKDDLDALMDKLDALDL
jgi:NAD-dependent dihydropyrimidine dehydrogenase PreA subunit